MERRKCNNDCKQGFRKETNSSHKQSTTSLYAFEYAE